jgi:lipopolysaccharide export system protein LptA
MKGVGHASLEQTALSGARQTISGDRLEAHFAAGLKGGLSGAGKATTANAARIQSARVDGHVVLMQYPASTQGTAPEPPLHATAGQAVYESVGQWLHLSQSPRVENGELQLTAQRIDVSQTSGDAFAHGDVKATWFHSQAGSASGHGQSAAAPSVSLGGQGPVHAIASEADLHQDAGEVVFQGHVRLWQQGDSIAAPQIVLNRTRQTLVAHSANRAEPVRVVLVSTAGIAAPGGKAASGAATPSVIRLRGSDLKYSDAERKAVIRAGAAGNVLAQTATATTASDEVELTLLPPGNHAGRNGAAAQVDRMIASGHVTITAQGRRGTGEKLTYTSDTGEYVLTGTAAVPPRLSDPVRGTVTGQALIFNTHDDSVSIEGDGGKTTTETTAPR